MKKILIAISALFLSSLSFAETIQCKVVGVIDGNTITCLTKQKGQIKVILHHIDAPELDQPYGQESKRALFNMLSGQNVDLSIRGKDKYKRTLGMVYFVGHSCSKANSVEVCAAPVEDVNSNMISSGYAWYSPFGGDEPNYKIDEINARDAKLGLWSQPNPVPPWEWRKQNKSK